MHFGKLDWLFHIVFPMWASKPEHIAQDYFTNSTLTQWQWDSLFGHYWLQDELNCDTRSAHCLTYMVAGWLMIAGILQLFINFDNLRQKVFPESNGNVILPKSIKLICMYIFFVCDWYWVVLMVKYKDVIGWQQIIGSAVDIAIRLVFVTNPNLMFATETGHKISNYLPKKNDITYHSLS